MLLSYVTSCALITNCTEFLHLFLTDYVLCFNLRSGSVKPVLVTGSLHWPLAKQASTVTVCSVPGGKPVSSQDSGEAVGSIVQDLSPLVTTYSSTVVPGGGGVTVTTMLPVEPGLTVTEVGAGGKIIVKWSSSI